MNCQSLKFCSRWFQWVVRELFHCRTSLYIQYIYVKSNERQNCHPAEATKSGVEFQFEYYVFNHTPSRPYLWYQIEQDQQKIRYLREWKEWKYFQVLLLKNGACLLSHCFYKPRIKHLRGIIVGCILINVQKFFTYAIYFFAAAKPIIICNCL